MAQMISGILLIFSSMAMILYSVQHLALNCLGFITGGWLFFNGRKNFLIDIIYDIFR